MNFSWEGWRIDWRTEPWQRSAPRKRLTREACVGCILMNLLEVAKTWKACQRILALTWGRATVEKLKLCISFSMSSIGEAPRVSDSLRCFSKVLAWAQIFFFLKIWSFVLAFQCRLLELSGALWSSLKLSEPLLVSMKLWKTLAIYLCGSSTSWEFSCESSQAHWLL